MDRLEVITGITEKELLKKMAETILNKKYVVVPFEFGNSNHMSKLDDSIKRDCTLEARLEKVARNLRKVIFYKNKIIGDTLD